MGLACERLARACRLAAWCLLWLAGPALALELTAQERAWLAAHDPVMVGVGPPSPHPLAYYTVQLPPGGGEPIVTGHAADLMALIAERAGMRIRYVSVPDAPTGFALIVKGQLHMTPVGRMTPARRLLLTMPEALVSTELVWVVRAGAPPMNVLQKDGRLRAAVAMGTPVESALRDAFPRAQVTGVAAESAGVPLVADGRADITLLDVNSAIQAIERGRLPGLEIRRTPELTAASKGVKLQPQAPRADLPLRFGGLRLAQTVHKLVGNAIKFTAAGEVVVTGRWDPAAARLRVEVLDTGPGLAEGEIDRLWEPYTQGTAGRHTGAGAGLGLAITREIIQAMGGTVQAEPRPQRGSRFCFEVPLEIAA